MLTIHTFSEFESLMDSTIEETEQYQERFPGIAVYGALREQLDFIKKILIDEKRAPTMSEINSTSVGMIAIKNFNDDMPAYSEMLKEVNYVFYEYSKIPYLKEILK